MLIIEFEMVFTILNLDWFLKIIFTPTQYSLSLSPYSLCCCFILLPLLNSINGHWSLMPVGFFLFFFFFTWPVSYLMATLLLMHIVCLHLTLAIFNDWIKYTDACISEQRSLICDIASVCELQPLLFFVY